ncbi:MAG: alpha/beta hydrolase [Dongiaceae bacterium]
MPAESIYLDYDRAALDLQYNNQRRVPGFDDYVAGWQRESARVRAALPGPRDVAFGPTADEVLDIYTPARADGAAPVQVFYHGGYWRSFKASDFAFVAERLVEAGALAVIVNYALVPTVRIGELVRQCRAALAWVHANIARYGGDPRRIYVSGHSAGGHLTAMMTAAAPQPGEPDTRGLVRGGVALSGLYDLEPIRLCYLQETLQLTPAEVTACSPARHLPAASAPLALAYGAEESAEFARHSTEYGRALGERGIACSVRALAGHNHMSICTALADARSEPLRLILGQMGLG